jgi:hypothetical protein
MASKRKTSSKRTSEEEVIYLLKYLLALELYRSGLTKEQVRARLKADNNLISEMLSGIKPPKSSAAE